MIFCMDKLTAVSNYGTVQRIKHVKWHLWWVIVSLLCLYPCYRATLLRKYWSMQALESLGGILVISRHVLKWQTFPWSNFCFSNPHVSMVYLHFHGEKGNWLYHFLNFTQDRIYIQVWSNSRKLGKDWYYTLLHINSTHSFTNRTAVQLFRLRFQNWSCSQNLFFSKMSHEWDTNCVMTWDRVLKIAVQFTTQKNTDLHQNSKISKSSNLECVCDSFLLQVTNCWKAVHDNLLYSQYIPMRVLKTIVHNNQGRNQELITKGRWECTIAWI